MKPQILIILILVALTFHGCEKIDSPASTVFSIDDRINSARPINRVTVDNYFSSGNSITFDRVGRALIKMNDAYAQNGYFIVKTDEYGDYYFNLELIKSITIDTNEISLRY